MIKVFSLFSGYGTDNFALKKLGIEHQCVGYSDIDEFASQCFAKNHKLVYTENGKIKVARNHGDVRQITIEELPDFNLLTGGFPCQAFSVAGKQKGELDPRGTLFYEIIRIAEAKQPERMLLENVKGLTSKRFKDTFNKILSELDRIGYKVFWKVLNSKDHGIPQSRARVWFVCYRKDIAPQTFKWPEPKPLTIFIKDILEPDVDEKYYLSPLLQERFAKYLEDKNRVVNLQPRSETRPSLLKNPKAGGHGQLTKNDGTSYCLDQNNTQGIVANRYRTLDGKGECYEARDDGCCNNLTSVQKDNLVFENKINVLGMLDSEGWEKRHEEIRRIYGTNGIMCTLPTGQGGGVIPKIREEIANALKARDYKGPPSPEYVEKQDFNLIKSEGMLRRLTPKECFRLQGFLNDEIKLTGISDSQAYKLAGNGQDVNVVSLILSEMLK